MASICRDASLEFSIATMELSARFDADMRPFFRIEGILAVQSFDSIFLQRHNILGAIDRGRHKRNERVHAGFILWAWFFLSAHEIFVVVPGDRLMAQIDSIGTARDNF